METFFFVLLGVMASFAVFIMGWQFGLYLQNITDTKAMRDLYRDDKADFYNDYYGEPLGKSDNLHHHTPKAKKPRKKK